MKAKKQKAAITVGNISTLVEKLDLQPGNVVLVKIPAGATMENLQHVKQGFELLSTRYKVAVIFMGEGITVESLPEDRMNKIGWFRFNVDRPN